jgi:hypothetical protein
MKFLVRLECAMKNINKDLKFPRHEMIRNKIK